ncbi:ATP-dependent DNA ligase [Flavobacterium noncentrifugens]|uniref:DNA ligase (ATP) n=1 Tax=Flavobacterium noncentrifugens TaxID=1128970 RepID=A0A1G9A196_9FLAO|nr:DNA ligase D [Flavobacterium noncentrifugens]GEP51752.1 ATP-dependent DNA ligase [Flavobacterium noncentrifugens]SDK21031.1 bifunctional non-homologous end joining protein LigD [Flavobacterium noncentrifugens]
MALEKYNAKRDFKKTAEPQGVKKSSNGALRFVVQKHAASHLHYDFRLEIDGVLVSWAVPKGPSSNPADKRLAMHVEDHPMDYIDFEGTIPKGEYGGGTVMVWDIGTYHAEENDAVSKDNLLMKKQLKSGSIKVVLDGGKLHGSWHLVKMKGENDQWLLMKSKDEFADKKEFDPNSILTGRDFDAIAKGKKVWHRNRESDEKIVEDPILGEIKSDPKKAVKKLKSNDEFTAEDLADAKKISKFPDDWRPQLATLADETFDNDDWIFETKFDGYRALAQIQNSEVTLLSRNGLPFNSKYPEIAKTLESIANDLILDGEIVVEDSKGKSHFQWLQHLEEKPKQGQLKFYVFDILYFQGYDLRELELLQRKKILKAILPKLKNIVYSEHTIGNGTKAFAEAVKKNGEGIIAKKSDSKYYTDKRTKDWLKIKTDKQQEMVIGGFTEPRGGRVGIGALLCGYYDGSELKYSGKVGSGYTETILKDLRHKLDKIERKSSPFTTTPKEPGVHWVSPKLVAQIKFSEFTDTGSMRHPVYLGLRSDKNPKDVIMETPKVETENVAGTKSETKKATTKKATKKPAESDKALSKELPSDTKVEFTNLDKIYFPKEKITKGDVVQYYNSVADYILPYLIDRPESLRRTPDGINSEGFFQKNVAGTVPKWIKTRKIKSDSAETAVEWLLCQDKETLLFLANYGCIEMNPWSSRIGSLNNPDYIIFDLDPKGAPMKNIVKTALKVKEILDSLSVPAYIKTSGGNGLHVFIPVEPKYTYEQTRNFSHLVSQMVHRDLPEITSLERMPNKRKGKVYLDFLQNGKGKTMASIYSLRPREGAGVSTPLEWNEINDGLDLKAFNIKTIPDRLADKGDLWKDFFKNAINLKEILSKI